MSRRWVPSTTSSRLPSSRNHQHVPEPQSTIISFIILRNDPSPVAKELSAEHSRATIYPTMPRVLMLVVSSLE